MTGKVWGQNKSKREEEARSRGFVRADRESWVDAALTRASRGLQKNATAAPLALSLDRERDPNRRIEKRDAGSEWSQKDQKQNR
jgi:hypothetical protein